MEKEYILVRLFKVKDALPKPKGSLKVTNAENGEIVYQTGREVKNRRNRSK